MNTTAPQQELHDPLESTAENTVGQLLEITDLRVETSDGTAVVDGISLSVREHEVVCLVGESGSGKSVTMLAALGLLGSGLRVTRGAVRYRGRELLGLSPTQWRRLRGKELGVVFQDPMTALNPVKRVGHQVARAVRLHTKLGNRASRRRAVELLEQVGIREASTKASAYPHQWSGGMRQRAVIAMAMANDPDVLVADEPTTALDVTVQAQVMDVLADARRRTGAALVMITHDLGLVAEVADRVAVMYSGRIVEEADVFTLYDAPAHPYTKALLGSLLTAQDAGTRAVAVPGSPPNPAQRPAGCPFAPRCTNPAKSARCGAERPALQTIGVREVACHFPLVSPPQHSSQHPTEVN